MEEAYPVCQHCGSQDLIIVYEATVTQRANQISIIGENTWHVDMYDCAEIDFDSGVTNIRLECQDCGGEVAKENPTNTFVVPLKEGGNTP